jgi:S-adenosylhomocysteine hydrolase
VWFVNLAAAAGHPPSVRDMSFATQTLATAKLASMGISIDTMTADQKKSGESWEHRT